MTARPVAFSTVAHCAGRGLCLLSFKTTPALYVREDAIIPALDAWIAELTDPKVLTAAAIDPPLDPANEALRHHVSELDR